MVTGTGTEPATVAGTGTETGTGTGAETVTGTVTISISAHTMEPQKTLYTHKHCDIKHIVTCAFSFLSFTFNQTEPQQRVAGYS
jgi:hypothetical protein